MLTYGNKFPKQNIFDIFRQGANGGGQNTNNAGGNNAGGNNGGGDGNNGRNVNDPANGGGNNGGKNDGNNNNNNNNGADKSPLAEWAGLWDTPTVKDGETPPTDWNDHSSVVPKMNIDPKKLFESAKRIDFAKVANPERVAAALKGDAGAFNEVLNSVMQAAFAHSAMSTSKIVEAMSGQMAEKMFSGALPHHIRKHTVNSAIDAEMPILSDPAVAPMFELFKAQMQAKYPKLQCC
jgi:hypothetical protein